MRVLHPCEPRDDNAADNGRDRVPWQRLVWEGSQLGQHVASSDVEERPSAEHEAVAEPHVADREETHVEDSQR